MIPQFNSSSIILKTWMLGRRCSDLICFWSDRDCRACGDIYGSVWCSPWCCYQTALHLNPVRRAACQAGVWTDLVSVIVDGLVTNVNTAREDSSEYLLKHLRVLMRHLNLFSAQEEHGGMLVCHILSNKVPLHFNHLKHITDCWIFIFAYEFCINWDWFLTYVYHLVKNWYEGDLLLTGPTFQTIFLWLKI